MKPTALSLPVISTASTPADHCSLASKAGIQEADVATGAAYPLVYLETFGCQMNELDSQLVVSQLRGLGYRFTGDWKAADIVLYNTCSVREQAENKVLSRVGLVGMHKQERPGMVLGVIGCMAERDGVHLVKKYPQIDLLCGPGELDKVPMLLDNLRKTRIEDRGHPAQAQVALQGNTTRRSATLAAAEDQLEALDMSRSFAPRDQGVPGEDGEVVTHAGGRSAYVRITRGCNKFCTYCVVPNTRGAEVHRHPDAIVEECRRLVEAGVIEITLLGQTVNHYHYDLAQATRDSQGRWQPQVGTVISPNAGTGGASPVFSPTTVSFAQLLRRIHDEIPGLARLRFVTNYPRDFGDDILAVIRDSPRICRYLHLPVQSGSNRMLAKMNRGYRVEQYFELLDRVRVFLPDAELATDIIVGFPGETDEDFAATEALLRRGRYKNSFIFKYSPRPGTAAFDHLADDVPDEVKRVRNNRLLALQAEISMAVHQGYIGRTVEVLVEGISRKGEKDGEKDGAIATPQLSGRTGGDLIVFFPGDPALVGTIVQVEIDAAAPLAMMGRLAGK